MKWFIYTRGTIHFHRLFATLKSADQFRSKIFGTPFNNVLYINEGPKLWWGWNEKEIRGIGRHIIKLCSKTKSRLKFFNLFENSCKLAIIASEKIRKTDLTKLTGRKLAELYDYLYKNITFALAVTMTAIDAIDIVFENYLLKKIKNELPKKMDAGEAAKICKIFLTSVHVSYIQKQELEILEAALKNRSENADKMYKKYWWTRLGWENMEPHSRDFFKKEIIKAIKQKNFNAKIKQIKKCTADIKKQRKIIIEKYNFSKEIAVWLEILDKYTYLHDLRKEMQVRTTYAAYLLMSEVARRYELSREDLEWLSYDEVKKILKGGPLSKLEIKKRKKAICVIIDRRGFKVWSGEEAVKIRQRELKEDCKKTGELKGTGVSGGKAAGMAKVCSGAAEALKKIKKGDILVCGMTLPDYVSAMKLAKAIITDEGGITCHAAIISRELGIPCIVGTKIATKVLRDGDLVEVDAERGVVKILKNK